MAKSVVPPTFLRRSIGDHGVIAERGLEKVECGRRWGSAKAERGH